ncbi:MAG: hypothetical protein ACQKBU_08300 [Verrucomicrobiales bacterium]
MNTTLPKSSGHAAPAKPDGDFVASDCPADIRELLHVGKWIACRWASYDARFFRVEALFKDRALVRTRRGMFTIMSFEEMEERNAIPMESEPGSNLERMFSLKPQDLVLTLFGKKRRFVH